jgi:penicillin G amidase
VGFFERPDPRLRASADPAPALAVTRALTRHAIALSITLVVAGAAYVVNVAVGLHESSATRGEIYVRGLDAEVSIVRDRRDIPHIRAHDEHDLYFANGYVEGSDRLFQLDLSRRYAYGRLAEILGPKALPYDRAQRAVDIAAIAARQLRALDAHDRAVLRAYSDGINAAAATQPLPVEFRILLYRPAPWTPNDSLAVSIVASEELADPWHDIFSRDAVWRRASRCFDAIEPLSDPRYDVTAGGVRVARRAAPESDACKHDDGSLAVRPVHPAIGSNAWAAGARRSIDGDALVANDPHIDLTIPGIWYLIDLESPDVHAAGAAIPGIPGVALGHNERMAWASANAAMTTTSVFEAGRLHPESWVIERIGVRFARDVRVAYYRTAREFSVPDENDPSRVALVRWPIYSQTQSTIGTELALDRAQNVEAALRILAQYRGSPQAFILADRRGEVAYHIAGVVPDDPAWGRYVHPARDLHESYPPIAFDRLPGIEPSRSASALAANNKPYDSHYPYRLSAQFQPPYRAFRIAELLRARSRYDVAYFVRMQLDAFSPIDLEIARDVVRLSKAGPGARDDDATLEALAHWDGRYGPASRAASLEHALRFAIFDDDDALSERLRALRGNPGSAEVARDADGALALLAFRKNREWGAAGATRIEHLLAPMHFGFLNGDWLPGDGDEYTIHLQASGFAQGFRAVWDVGNWNRGGIVIPSGESGEPGSGHYTDLTREWIGGDMVALPFSRTAVDRDAHDVLVVRPR